MLVPPRDPGVPDYGSIYAQARRRHHCAFTLDCSFPKESVAGFGLAARVAPAPIRRARTRRLPIRRPVRISNLKRRGQPARPSRNFAAWPAIFTAHYMYSGRSPRRERREQFSNLSDPAGHSCDTRSAQPSSAHYSSTVVQLQAYKDRTSAGRTKHHFGPLKPSTRANCQTRFFVHSSIFWRVGCASL
jgi:hypothetical protein